MSAHLREVIDLPGVEGAVLSSSDGLSLESYGHYTELLAAELTALRATFERVSRSSGLGKMSRLAITAETLEIVVVTAGPYLAAVAMTRGIDTRPAQQALAKLALSLELPGASNAR
ncbi:roadblock/LC7 domain-containing protein [Deinococcus psychrotolerans]|uniref:Roadblock/LC7 domain-containing protein n=1 Tax=Deinococcus psychrotolerans TaxID=2489213 RepID=A0A3G8YBW3_9DEIO|nr:roadblock/LC7 domain-containing protein [Deinococcus psychrotolerans]AZI41697.1 roadblock/LC7 domain-containing protein [Deinococcus psychrotolerans]